jgi:hypothetical protein
MIAQQNLYRALARLMDFVALGRDHHAFADESCARSLQLGRLLDLDQTHAASALRRKIWIIAKCGDLDAHAFAGFNEESSGRSRDFFAVYRNVYVSHKNLRNSVIK